MYNNKKILICTVDCWNTSAGATTSKTFSDLFSDYDSENLANVYIREELPDSKICSRYFQISETKIIKSVFSRKTVTGTEVFAHTKLSESQQKQVLKKEKIYQEGRRKRSYIKLFIREIIWFFSKWKTTALDEFIASFKPDIVIFGMEGYIHFNRICRYIVKTSGAAAIGYFWDDNFTYKQRHGLGFKLFRFFQRKSLKKTAKICDAFLAITEKTKAEADELFNIDCTVLTKSGVFDENKVVCSPNGTVLKALYTGNLSIGRLSSLIAVGDAIKKINEDGTKIVLDVYTSTIIDDTDRKRLSPYVTLHDAVTQDEVLSLQECSDILLFIESLEKPFGKIARLSFSTKLVDYMKAGKCIFAVGDSDIAPMNYLSDNDIAVCAFGYEEIYPRLSRLIADRNVIKNYAEKAFAFGAENHSEKLIESKLSAVIDNLKTADNRGAHK